MRALSRGVWGFAATYSLYRVSTPLLIVAIILAVSMAIRAQPPLLRLNTSPSEPEGLYSRDTRKPIKVGALVLFDAPPAAYPYADARLGYLHHIPILKAVAAVGGDKVCTTSGRLVIDGHDLAPIMARDSHGVTLPHWIGCRRLRAGEIFVYSNRVPNSFDSRYYGPIQRSAATVYEPVLTTNGMWR
jgi:conjugative transfer signal peptidase TraF